MRSQAELGNEDELNEDELNSLRYILGGVGHVDACPLGLEA
jgi:hypothetical protein